jgi:hypothetical protein
VTIRQPGGRVGALESWVDGGPEFHVGEKALLFLRVAPDGTLRVAHLHQGKFRVILDPETGIEVGVRLRGGNVRMLTPRLGSPPADARFLDDLRRSVRSRASRRPERRFLGVTAPAPPTGPIEQTETFTFNGEPARWFEVDSGSAIVMYTHIDGEPRAPSRGFDQVRAGIGAWSDAESSFRFGDGGVTTAAGIVFDGVNSIAFGDPAGQIDPPVNCTGTLAQGGFFRSVTESRAVNGQPFWRVLEGDVVFADGWQGCGFYEVFANLAEVATHELGHVLGLGHSADADATMYGIAHFDGRGSALRADDRAGLRFVYPLRAPLGVALAGSGAGGVSSSPAGISCPDDCDEPWLAGTVVTLTATPGTGSTFSGWAGGGCSGTAPCRVTLSGPLTVTATFSTTALGLRFSAPASGATVSGATTVSLVASGGSDYTYQVRLDGGPIYAGTSASFTWDTTTATNGAHTLSATATDSLGRTTTASVPVTVSNTTGGALRVALTQPASGATVSGTPWAVMWVEGATGTSNTFTLTLGGRVMGTSTTSSRGPVSMPYDTRTVADGAQPLTATVRDATGATGSATITLTVANGTAPPPPPPAPLTASFSSPAAGAVVAGSVSVGMSVSGSTASSRTFRLAVDGTEVSAQTTSATSASFAWNTASATNGGHTLTLTVTDANGASGTASRSVTVQNPSPPPPTGTLRVYITQPTSGATVRGTAWVTLWLEGASGSSNTYTLSAAGATVATTTTSSTGPITLAWATGGTPDGAQTLTASARDATGNTGGASIAVTVANGATTPPPAPAPLTAAFTSPAEGATVRGTVTVDMSAAGASGAATYTLTVDGASVSTQTTTSGSASAAWNTTTVADGAHTLGLSVTDGAGRTATATRAVSVANAGPPASGTLRVFVTSPAAGATVNGTVWVNVWVEGAAGSSNVYTLSVDGVTVASETSAGVHVTPRWDSRATGNGTRTLTATVRDASGNSGSAAVTVTVAN